ncbi:lipopolysaccharide ABC transporter, periplasmic protein LptA [Syntrophotalea carbinolica DSM 2380]|uniref:Lipopolysaccharide ABC transporter, periplasmic protein LptA n=1 Tax=Syntrophotalea carbinolica (strain DSM 2380 / NBRC 103641 / GraBd1) TaxID=338963 RepID=Q3A376_SYNC1|nr:lipopolysaccharide transport periplasmic protein LptA [Syntrophotalea carbinolica]ABA89181.1 lipopolysaccharide ABC transporter, periplasmic protein LptA [Syntrophotalea carbinolica DSM 2380]
MGLMRVLLVTVLVSLSLVDTAWCEASATAGKAQPLEITSQKLEADGTLKKVVFVGKVVARQDGLTIRSSKLIVAYGQSGTRVSSIEAIGDVVVQKDDRTATAGRGLYNVAEGTVVLTETPRVQQGDNSVEGDEIVFYLEEDRSIVKSQSGSRVRAILTPGGTPVEP